MNMCMPYEPEKYPSVKVCGANTKVQVFLRGRCESYYAYIEEVGACTGGTTDNCRTVTLQDSHWLKAAQSYVIVPCGATQGEVNDYEGKSSVSKASTGSSMSSQDGLVLTLRLHLQEAVPISFVALISYSPAIPLLAELMVRQSLPLGSA